MNKQLEIALAKLRPFLNTGNWYAVLSYSEILALYKDGYKECEVCPWIDYAKEELKLGKSGTLNTYWTKIGKHKPHFNKVDKPDKRNK